MNSSPDPGAPPDASNPSEAGGERKQEPPAATDRQAGIEASPRAAGCDPAHPLHVVVEMRPPPRRPAPGLDAGFWFSLSNKLITRATTVPTKAAARLQAGVGWFWTAYTLAVTAGLGLAGDRYARIVRVAFAIPALTLVVSYWLAVRAQMPVVSKFDARVPDLIRQAYVRGVESKKETLDWALRAALASALLVALALVLTAWIESTPRPALAAERVRTPEADVVGIAADVAPGVFAILRTTPLARDGTAGLTVVQVHRASRSGDLAAEVTGPHAYQYQVSIEWPDGTLTRSMSVRTSVIEPQVTLSEPP